MTTPIVLLGAGGHARSILQLLERINDHSPTYSVLGLLDDSSSGVLVFGSRSLPLLGPLSALGTLGVTCCVPAGGFPALRRAIVATVPHHVAMPVLIDPASAIGSKVGLGVGVTVFDGAIVSSGVVVGDHAHVSWGAAVGHRTEVGEYASILPGASVSGGCTVGAGAVIGANAVVLPGVRVGAGATVGAGAIVARDVPEGATVVGMPARELAR